MHEVSRTYFMNFKCVLTPKKMHNLFVKYEINVHLINCYNYYYYMRGLRVFRRREDFAKDRNTKGNIQYRL